MAASIYYFVLRQTRNSYIAHCYSTTYIAYLHYKYPNIIHTRHYVIDLNIRFQRIFPSLSVDFQIKDALPTIYSSGNNPQ